MMTGLPLLMALLLGSPDQPAGTPNVPAPQPTPLRTIGTVRADPACVALHRLALPIVTIASVNERDFAELRAPIAKFRSGKGSVADGSPTHDALANNSADLLDSSGKETNAEHDPLALDSNDDQNTFTPERTLAASNIDRAIGIIQHNLGIADRIMAESWRVHPGTRDPALNAIRQRVQNIIDLQRALAFRLDDVVGIYLSNAGVAELKPLSERANYKSALDKLVDAGIAEDQSTVSTEISSAGLPDQPVDDVKAMKRAHARDVLTALHVQEDALSIEGPRLENACNVPAVSPTP